ncbi:MAG: hypothetical protein WAT39_20080 [Planctomycetota bacterium]
MKPLPPILSLLLAATATAQTVTTTLTALTQVNVSVTANGGALANGQSLAAGPLPAQQLFDAELPAPTYTNATLQWNVFATPSVAAVHLGEHGWVTTPNSTANVGPVQLLVRFAATAPTTVAISILQQSEITGGTPAPTAALDLGNDGSIDWPFVPWYGVGLPTVPLGPQPFDIRVLLDTAIPAPGQSATYLQLEARPVNSLAVTPTVASCPFPNVELTWAPTFADRGIDLQPPSLLSALVIGFQPQPALFPTLGTTCVLWPAPDVVLALFGAPLHVPLPAAVRPATLQAQAVLVTTIGNLLLTNGLHVQAY